MAHILLLLFAATLAAAEEPPAEKATSDSARKDDVANYARWVGTERTELLQFWGQPHKVKRKDDGRVMIYELVVTCDGIISGTQFTRLGNGLVTGSQDPLDGIDQNVPQGATRRAGAKVAAKQTVRFHLDAGGTVARYEATEPKTNWKRCKY